MTSIRTRANSSPASGPAATALRLLALLLGVFFLFQGLNKLPWLMDAGILGERLGNWMRNAPPSVRWYLETFAIPGVPLFARLVPLAELGTGIALVIGFWPRLVAALGLVMVANFHFALSSYYSMEFFRDGAGLPVMGGLLALAIGGARLPWSVKP
jgi:uncharacterized membrane protein YphA (DoxX/SURF4 family)